MTIDGTKVQHNTARCFSAIGGGYGVKMLIHESQEEFVLGPVGTRRAAESIVDQLNACENGEAIKSAELMARARA